jgi:hypothetical protein
MNWQAISAVSGIIAAVAVVVSLIYLAIQIRDDAKASRAAAVTDATAGIQAWYQELGSNPQTAKLFLHSIFLGFQRSYFLSKAGTLDVGLRDSIGTAVHAVNHLPGVRFYWQHRRIFFQPEFVAWVETLLARPPISALG